VSSSQGPKSLSKISSVNKITIFISHLDGTKTIKMNVNFDEAINLIAGKSGLDIEDISVRWIFNDDVFIVTNQKEWEDMMEEAVKKQASQMILQATTPYKLHLVFLDQENTTKIFKEPFTFSRLSEIASRILKIHEDSFVDDYWIYENRPGPRKVIDD